MAEKPKKQSNSVPIEMPPSGFRKRMLFNRFAVISDGDFRLLHFGYISAANLLADSFVCAIHSTSLEVQKQENLDYLGRLGELSLPEPGIWQPPAASFSVELVNLIGLCRRGSEAEVVLHNFPVKSLLDWAKTRKEGSPLPSEAIALLRSETELHKHFIRALYPL